LNSAVALDTVEATASTALPITDLGGVLTCDLVGLDFTEAVRAAPAGMLRLPKPELVLGADVSVSLLRTAFAPVLAPALALDLGAAFLAIRTSLNWNRNDCDSNAPVAISVPVPAYSRPVKR
jgi:hypothetical protein